MQMQTATIEQKQHFDAKPVQVYAANLNPKKHAEFTGGEVGAEDSAWDGAISGKTLAVEGYGHQ
jgi:hypothetical protein